MKRIIVVGSINMDIVVLADRHPKPGETVAGNDIHFIPGGKGANQAVAASRLGGFVSLVGKVGNDAFGEKLRAFLKNEKLDLNGLTISADFPTGTALIVVDQRSENTIVVVPGCNSELSVTDVDSVHLTGNDIVVSQFEIPQAIITELFKRANQARATTVLNPAPAAYCSAELLARTDHLIVNETELAFLTGSIRGSDDIHALAAEARKLRTRSGQIIIVTLGAGGVISISDNDLIEVEGHKVDAIDTTAAGDCFIGAFAVALSESMSITAALEFANTAAAISVQRLGASSSLPLRTEVETFLRAK